MFTAVSVCVCVSAAGCWWRVAVSTLPQVPAGYSEGAQSLVVPRDPHHSTQAL